jgi:Putative phage metallopeptidase
MPTFQRCEKFVDNMARAIINKHASHAPLKVHEVRIDFVFAFCDRDEKTNVPLNDALKKNGVKALGIARKLPLKDRALDRGDAEIALDGDWWKEATEAQQVALLDHELHHLAAKMDKHGNIQFDDLGRPLLRLRHHDYEFGWFNIVAERNREASQERIQAKAIMDNSGQLYWPAVSEAKK